MFDLCNYVTVLPDLVQTHSSLQTRSWFLQEDKIIPTDLSVCSFFCHDTSQESPSQVLPEPGSGLVHV